MRLYRPVEFTLAQLAVPHDGATLPPAPGKLT
jgi:hypothetical protein